MAQKKVQFGPYNDELPASGLRSGVGIETLNTTIDSNTIIGGRLGFDVYDDDVSTLGEILNMHVATFEDGSTYIVTKRSDGKLYHRKVYPTVAGSWTLIVALWPFGLHTGNSKGWFYMWADRLYYVDKVGGTKWHPTDGTWKAGIENPQSPAISDASDGGKEGWYHIAVTHVNLKTGEESATSGMQTPGVEVRRADGKGGITITNWKVPAGPGDGTGVSDQNSDFEYNGHFIYTSLGNTEQQGLGSGDEQYSMNLYREAFALTSVVEEQYSNIFRMDTNVVSNAMLSNKGGQPPGAEFGCWNGSQALYLEVYPIAKWSSLLSIFGALTLAKGVMMYSVPGFPAMVPQITLEPIPKEMVVPFGGTHEVATGIEGLITGCSYLGGTFFVFTNSSTYSMTLGGSGNVSPTIVDAARGAVGWDPVVKAGASVHALGKNVWLRIGEGLQDISHEQFTPTLEAIPSGGIAATVGGHYSARNEVWFAVAKTGGTKAQRILIWNEQRLELVAKYDPANLSTAGIVSMAELTAPNQAPIMLLALDDGRILSWPGSQYTDEVVGSSNLPYACNWKGIIGQEQRANDGYMKRCAVSMEMIPATGVTIAAAGIQDAGQASTETLIPHIILPWVSGSAEKHLEPLGEWTFDAKNNGKMFVFELSSTTDQGADWKVGDLFFEIDRDNNS